MTPFVWYTALHGEGFPNIPQFSRLSRWLAMDTNSYSSRNSFDTWCRMVLLECRGLCVIASRRDTQ